MRDPWPHQLYACEEVAAARRQGERLILLTSPTGGGKTAIMEQMAVDELIAGGRVVLYTNRKALMEQTSNVLKEAGLLHGIRASGYRDRREYPLQISSIQTEAARSLKSLGECFFCEGDNPDCFSCHGTGKEPPKWELHNATLALVDEAHLQKEATAQKIINAHAAAGCCVVGVTATPLGLGEIYQRLIVAGKTSELRGCGALVPCIHYGPDEPDLREWKGLQEGKDLTEKQARKSIMTRGIFGRVLYWFNRINPTRRPSILFGADVASSLWFAEQFVRAGISAAHIDGDDIWMEGKLHRSSRQAREELFAASKEGRITVICNRFVCREGINAPWLSHGIFATVFGALQSFIQSGGRLLRSATGKDVATIQDHGGNWHRHGSLNADREWDLTYTGPIMSGLRIDRMRAKVEKEPVRCPKCSMILTRRCCPCGWELTWKPSRPVVQSDGTLIELEGEIYRPRRTYKAKNGPEKWKRIVVFRCRAGTKGERTFRAAAALFARENYWNYPDPQWPLMPTRELDWFRLVSDVPVDRLTTEESWERVQEERAAMAAK